MPKDKDSSTPLHEVAANNSNPDVVKALISDGAEVNATRDNGRTPLHEAADKNSNPDVVKALISAGAKVNAKEDTYGRTPLHVNAAALLTTQTQM